MFEERLHRGVTRCGLYTAGLFGAAWVSLQERKEYVPQGEGSRQPTYSPEKSVVEDNVELSLLLWRKLEEIGTPEIHLETYNGASIPVVSVLG